MKTAKNERCELLLPGEVDWELWSWKDGLWVQATQGSSGPRFEGGNGPSLLGIPVAMTSVVPAWLHGEEAQLKQIAELHLEKLGVPALSGSEGLQVEVIQTTADYGNLVRISAIRDLGSAMQPFFSASDECHLSATFLPLVQDSVTVWKELGRWVFGITVGNSLIYSGVLSSLKLDHQAMMELHQIFLHLGLQKMPVSGLKEMVIWSDDERLSDVFSAVKLKVRRCARPAPLIPSYRLSSLMTKEMIERRVRKGKKRRNTRLALISFAVASVFIAALGIVQFSAERERDALRTEIGRLAPLAVKMDEQRRLWEEIEPAVSTELSPMSILRNVGRTPSASEVSLTHFGVGARALSIRGRAGSASAALQFVKDVKDLNLTAGIRWEAQAPSIGNDNTAEFELKAERP
jgi:hypothetical protein